MDQHTVEIIVTAYSALAAGLCHHVILKRYEIDSIVPSLFISFLLLCLFTASLSSWRLVAIAAVSFLATTSSQILCYRAFFHPLRDFPGPFAARISRWWVIKKIYDNDSRYFIKVQRKLGAQYGDYVRTGPRELTIFNPAAIQPILGFGSKTTKGPYYDIVEESLHMTRNKRFHRYQRKAWDVTMKYHLEGFGDRIEKITSDLLTRIDTTSTETIPLNTLFREYSLEVITAFAFGKPSGTAGDPSAGDKELPLIIDRELRARKYLMHLPWLINVINSVFGQAGSRRRWNGWTEERLKEQLTLKDPHSGFVSRLMESSLYKAQDHKLLVADTQLVVGAGFETTASALLFIFIHLGIHPEYQVALRLELKNAAFSCEKPLPILDAIISESMRLWPSVFFTPQRVTPPEGLFIRERFIPGNTILAIATFSMARDERNFVRPNEFIPERWTTQPELCIAKSAFIPFLVGPYMCAGKNLAMMEMRSVVARVIEKFNVVLPGDFDASFFDDVQDAMTIVAPEVRAQFVPVATAAVVSKD